LIDIIKKIGLIVQNKHNELFVFAFVVLEIELRALYMLKTKSTTESYPLITVKLSRHVLHLDSKTWMEV
jgi:hypothetical protein